MIPDFDRRLARIARHRERLARRSARLSTARIVTFVLTVVLVTWTAFGVDDALAWGLAGLGFVVFQVLVRIQSRLEDARARWRIWEGIQQRQRARVAHDWSALPREHEDEVPGSHPFAHDLDLVGERSLLHLVDTSVSTGGHRRLRDWLLGTSPDPEVLRRRQRRVEALLPLRHLRDRLALVATRALGGRRRVWDTDRLVRWIGEHRDTSRLRTLVLVLGVFAAINVVLVVGWAAAGWTGWWAITVPVYFLGYVASIRTLADASEEAEKLEEILSPLRAVLGSLEERAVPGPLEEVVAPLRRNDAHRPSALLGRTMRIVWALSFRTNYILWVLLNVATPWDLIFALRLERTRDEIREHLPHWLEAWEELEALGALANFAALNEGTCFPELIETTRADDRSDGAPPVLEARALGHPLLHPAQRVRNDFEVDRLGRVLLVTGSNMSGKSTFLRTVGLNVALANAGSVVMATAMRLRPLRLFTCIQVSDSVNDGISYFYAEVRRLAALLRALEDGGDHPQISLIDEIYRGTNNRERWAGSRAFVEHLVGERGVVLLSTHDLELAALADTHEEVRNLHFREEVHDRRMEFDYVLREGPCPTTNALKLMEREGLPVPAGDGSVSPDRR